MLAPRIIILRFLLQPKLTISLFLSAICYLLIADCYAQWVEQFSGVGSALTSVSGASQECGWVCGNNGTVLRTTNGGMNWTNVSSNGIPSATQLINMFGVNNNLAFTAGNTGQNTYVYRTSNGGANWSQVFFQANGSINSVWMNGPIFGFMQGNPVNGRWSLWKTSSGGVNWDSTGLYLPQAGTETGWNNSMYADINNRIWFGTNNFRIYYSSNFGAGWSVQSTGSEQNIYTIFFGGAGYAAGNTLLRTTNMGTSWVQIPSAGSGLFGGIVNYLVYNDVWYVRSDNRIYYSSNSGSNWIVQYTAPSGNYRHTGKPAPFAPGVMVLWAVRDNGGISMRTVFYGDGLKQISNVIPGSYFLFQNYPNPFNSVTEIMFDLPRDEFVTIKVYDLLGEEISVLLNNEYKQTGRYRVSFDASELASGIYYYRIEAGKFTETRKMMLVK